MKEENQGAKFGEIGSILGDKWKKADESTKAKYQKMADDLKKTYEGQKEAYQKSKPAAGKKKAAAASDDEDEGSDEDDE